MFITRRRSTLIPLILFSLLLLVAGIESFYKPFHMNGHSMSPTISADDYIIVDKQAYRNDHLPERGDVVIFKLPKQPSIQHVKRIMGMPGDHIQVKGGIVYINGAPLNRQPLGNVIYSDENPAHTHPISSFSETLPEGKVITILKETGGGTLDNTQEFIVPPNNYFMLGDSRDHSADSVIPNIGYIPRENITGKALLIFRHMHQFTNQPIN
jgi:signal peptidase I